MGLVNKFAFKINIPYFLEIRSGKHNYFSSVIFQNITLCTYCVQIYRVQVNIAEQSINVIFFDAHGIFSVAQFHCITNAVIDL